MNLSYGRGGETAFHKFVIESLNGERREFVQRDAAKPGLDAFVDDLLIVAEGAFPDLQLRRLLEPLIEVLVKLNLRGLGEATQVLLPLNAAEVAFRVLFCAVDGVGVDLPFAVLVISEGHTHVRVPAIVVSAYSPKRVCKVQLDHTAVMKAISVRWGVQFPESIYGRRWAAAPDLWRECFDFSQAPMAQGTYTNPNDALERLRWGDDIHAHLSQPVSGVMNILERIFVLPELKLLDQRASMFDTLSNLERTVVTGKRLSNAVALAAP